MELIKAVAWPSVALYLFIQLKGPVKQIAAELPKKLAAAKELKAGSFSLSVQEAAFQIGQPEIATALRSLSQDGRAQFLTLGRASYRITGKTTNPNWTRYHISDRKALFKELVDSGLVRFKQDLEEYRKFVSSLGLKEVSTSEHGTLYEAVRPLTNEEDKRLTEQDYSHTELGRTAFNLIVDIASRF